MDQPKGKEIQTSNIRSSSAKQMNTIATALSNKQLIKMEPTKDPAIKPMKAPVSPGAALPNGFKIMPAIPHPIAEQIAMNSNKKDMALEMRLSLIIPIQPLNKKVK
jgi:hypothetical protein